MNKILSLLLFCCFTFTGLLAHAETQVVARINADRVNLRAKSDLQSETVYQVASGTMLKVRSVEGSWIQVIPPDDADFWIHKDFVDKDEILVNKLNARSGAGINYNVVGTFSKGDKIIRRGSFGEWIKVAPTPDASLWVSRDLAELIEPAVVPPPVAALRYKKPVLADSTGESETNKVTEVTTTPTVKMPKEGDVAAAPAETSIPPDGITLVPLDGQGRLVKYEGELKRAPLLMFKSPGTHRLIKREGIKLITVVYLQGNIQQLDSMLNEQLIVQGKEYWTQNVRAPVVVVESIERPRF